MGRHTLFYSTLFLLLTINVSGQEKLSEISFQFADPMGDPSFLLDVEIRCIFDSSTTIHLKYSPILDDNGQKTDSIYSVPFEVFETISKSVRQIKLDDISLKHGYGKDGTNATLKFAYGGNAMELNFWSPEFKTKERGLENFYATCNLIAKTVDIEIFENERN